MNWRLQDFSIRSTATVCLILLAIASPGLAEDIFEGLEQYTIRPAELSRVGQKLTPHSQKILAQNANPLFAFSETETTPEELATKLCRDLTPDYFEVLKTEFARLNPELARTMVGNNPILKTKIEAGTAVLLPFCISRDTTTKTISDGMTIWDEWLSQSTEGTTTLPWNEFQAKVMKLNKLGPDGVVAVKPGAQILFPVDTQNVVIRKTVFDNLSREQDGKILPESFKPTGPPKFALPKLFQDNLEPRFLEQCSQNATPTGGDSPAERVLEQASEAILKNEEFLSKNGGVEENKVRVMVLDSGLLGVKLPPGIVDTPNPILRKLITRIDGVSSKDMISIPGDPDRQHGTGVLVLASGGRLFWSTTALIGRLQIIPYRIRATAPGGGSFPLSATEITKGLERAQRQKVNVVNFSAFYSNEDVNFSQYIGNKRDNAGFLLVAAAGNDGVQLGTDDGSARAFPALLNGIDNNLIVVGAIAANQTWADFSNHSNKFVNIAVGGCNVPTMGVEEIDSSLVSVKLSGTSFATPQVTFVAALLDSFGNNNFPPLSPIQTKRRILSSADINVPLWTKVEHGRVLNIWKTLALYEDVLTLRSGNVGFGAAKFSDDQGIEIGGNKVDLCPGVQVKPSDIRKISFVGPAVGSEDKPERAFLIYIENSNITDEKDERPFETRWCDDLSIHVKFTDTKGEVQIINSSNILDYVPKQTFN